MMITCAHMIVRLHVHMAYPCCGIYLPAPVALAGSTNEMLQQEQKLIYSFHCSAGPSALSKPAAAACLHAGCQGFAYGRHSQSLGLQAGCRA